MNINEAKAGLEVKISRIAGVPVELTVRGESAFTFSLPEVNKTAADKIADFFASMAKVSVEHDDECGSFVYVECDKAGAAA